MLAIGRTVELWEAAEGENQGVHALKSRVADIVENRYIALEIPIDQETGKERHFPRGAVLLVSFIDEGGARNRFWTKVLGYGQENIPLLLIEIPEPDRIRKEQRRNFFRIEAQVNLAIRLSEPGRNYHFLALTTDISGGGLSFACEQTYVFQRGDVLDLWMILPMRGQIHRLHCQGEVVRIVFPDEKGREQTVSVKFLALREEDLQKIVCFCFEKELELRKKGIL